MYSAIGRPIGVKKSVIWSCDWSLEYQSERLIELSSDKFI